MQIFDHILYELSGRLPVNDEIIYASHSFEFSNEREYNFYEMFKKSKTIIWIYLIILTISSVFLFSLLLKAQNSGRNKNEPNILLITLDTTRADRIGCYGYEKANTPNIDALASQGVRFENAYSPVPLTLPAHCSILTGTYPIYHQVHNNGFYYLDQEHLTLAEIMKDMGYKTAAFVSSFTLDSRFGIDQGFDIYDDTFSEDEILKNFRSERIAEQVFSSFFQWIDKYFDKKFFCMVHFFDPHLPYDPPSPFKEKFADRRYDGEIAYMDHYIGKIMNVLRDKNVLDNTLIILVGDHGEALGEKKEIDHGLFIYDNTLKVPLIFYSKIRIPKGMILPTRVRLIDIMPTILDMLKIRIPKEIQGESLLPLMRGRKKEDFPVYIETYYPRENFGWSQLTGSIDGEWKYIHAPRPELYNLKKDPREEMNVIQKEATIAWEMSRKLEDLTERSSKKDAKRRRLTQEEEEKLRSLGYVIGEFSEVASKKPLPDPKDKIEDYLFYFRGNLYETQGDYQKAVECYTKVLDSNPDVPSNYVNLSFVYMKMNKIDEAIDLLEKGDRRIPGSILILSRLINLYLRAERYEDAFRTSQIVLTIDPQYFDALFLAGSIKAKMQKWEDALTFYQKALDIEPENKTLRMRHAFTLAALGRNDEALKEYMQLKNAFPQDYQIHKDLSLIYEAMGKLELARENLKKALELHPSPEIYYDYAFLLEKAGYLKEAIHWLTMYLNTTSEGSTHKKNEAQNALTKWKNRLKKHQ